ncbi:multidrug DMT transporter [Candidatus Tenderia electrophaga]|jgi:drug/metabolite transporter (DMT)-like permease|uniref:Multidrug DMT transporter n=1 Tax=Candidatus Tenderia electrophaga TaxID=1748243 RepID=A0A0S2TA49_9GAMM|nr:multidrug DMT transporter [Candidatus Tenderia electrophaga]
MSVPAAFTGIILIWATTPLAIKWSSEEAGFLFGLTARMVLGAAICVALIALLRVPFHWHRDARHTYLASGLGLYGAMMCVYWGAQYISSGLVSVVYGLLPMVTFFVAALVLGHSLWQPDKLLGALLGFAGLLVIFQPQDRVSAAAALGIAAVLASATIHALSMVRIKQIGADLHALSVTGGGLMVAVPLYVITWLLFDGHLPTAVSEKTVSAIVYLGVMGSVVGFVAFYYALKHVSANAIALLTLITPVLALSLGHWLNHEPLQPEVIAGAACILLGLALHNWGDKFFARNEEAP